MKNDNKNIGHIIWLKMTQVTGITDKKNDDLGKSLNGEAFDDLHQEDISPLLKSHNVELSILTMNETAERNEDVVMGWAPQELTLNTLQKRLTIAYTL